MKSLMQSENSQLFVCNRSDQLAISNEWDWQPCSDNGAGATLVTKMIEMIQFIVPKPSIMVNAHMATSLPNLDTDFKWLIHNVHM